MRARGPKFSVLLFVVAVLVCTGSYSAVAASSYSLQVVSPSAIGLIEGTPVMVKGFQAGSIDSIEVRGAQAVVSVSLDGDFVPLHAGASASVSPRVPSP